MSEKPNRARRSPQEKKKLSYERDRVNTYGENDKGSRKSIRKFKRASNRTLRHKTRTLTRDSTHDDRGQRADSFLADSTYKGLHEYRFHKRKIPDAPLALVIDKRPLQRVGGADRARTHNVRESLKAILEQRSNHEQQWLQREIRKKAERDSGSRRPRRPQDEA